MAIVNTHYGFCSKGGALPQFTYTGNYNMRDDGVVELLTSGTLVFLNPGVIDVFCVGGGGGGGWNPKFRNDPSADIQYGGGGGGKTNTILKQAVNGSYQITIGNGGNHGNNGDNTSFGNLITAEGGKGAPSTHSSSTSGAGGAGGSGGGGGTFNNGQGGNGGSNGGKGIDGYPSSSHPGGVGQGVTTREFGDPNGKLYAGGGGGGRSMVSNTPVISMGGAGGGGNGGWVNQNAWQTKYQVPTAGAANTGGGGGGGYQLSQTDMTPGASGGSGIVCFRAAK